MLLCIWGINWINSIKQKLNVKNIQKFNNTCSDVRMWGLDVNRTRRIISQNIWILRKIFGPVQNEDGSWRLRMNYEPNKLIWNADIVRFIKSRRIAWLGHVMRLDDKRTPKRILECKPIGTRTRRSPRKREIAGIEEDLQIIGVRRWRNRWEERAEWKKIREKAKTHSGL
jgi:hypothetical protein